MADRIVSRKEDMSPEGELMIIHDGDGDIHVVIKEDPNIYEGYQAAVEFTSLGTGGGASPRTYKALLELMKAIKEDNEDIRHQGRAGEYSGF